MFGYPKRLLVAFIVVLLTAGFAYARIGTLFEEGDASPSGYAYKLVVPNGTLSIVNGVATLTIAGAGTVTTSGTINVDEIAVMAGATSIKSLTEAEFKAAYNMEAGTDYQSVISFGANVETALGVAIGSAGAPVLYDGAGGTPSAITLTNGTGLPIATGVSGLGANVATFLVTPTLANLNAAVSDATILDDGAIADSTAIGLTTGDNYTNFGAITDDSLNEMFAAIDTALGGLSGDVTGVGDCASGACLDGSSDGGTYIRLYDGDSNYSQLASGNVAANLTFTFPTAYPGAANAIVVMSTAGVMSTLAATTYQASDAQLDDIAALSVAQGDILYVNGSGDIVNLGAGTSGYYLKTQGVGANPTWAAPPGGGDITAVGNCTNGDCFVDGGVGTSLTFEVTDNAYETVLIASEPEQANTVTIPDQTGSIVLGPASFAADNILVKTDGTESLTQATGITVDDSNNVSGVAGLTISGALSVGTDPADAGAIRLENAAAIMFEASPAGTDISALSVDASEVVQIGASGASGVTVTPNTIITGTLTVNGASATLPATSFGDLNITNVGSIALDSIIADGSAIVIGGGTETLAIDTSDWDISTTGAITGVAFDANGTGNTLTNINAADHADEDWGDFSVATGAFTLDADVVAAAEMADADHGMVAWSSGVATVEDFAVSSEATVADDIAIRWGGAATDWYAEFDDSVDDQMLWHTTATAAIATTDPMFEILVDYGTASGTNMTADQQVFGISKGTQATNVALLTLDEDGDLEINGTFTSNASGDSYLQLNNNSGGLAASGYRVYFETDGSDVISYSLNGSEKRFANLEDAQTFSGAKTFSYDIIMSEVADHQSTPGAGYGYLWVKSDTPSSLIFTDDAGTDYDLTAASSGDVASVGDCVSGACLDGSSDGGSYVRIYDGDSNYAEFQVPDISGDITYTFPSATSTIATLQGSDTQVIFNNGGTAYAGDAGFVFNSTTDALTLGENGQDGTLVLYNESGGTDYNLTLQPGTQSAAATITFPGSTSTLATLGLAETFSALKTFSAGIDIDEDVDIDFDANDEEMNIASSATDYAADSAMVTIINSGAGQTNAHYLLRLRHTADGDAQDHFLVAEDNNGDDMFKVDSGGVVTAVGAITSGGTITSSGLFDVTGATGLDLGSADVTDITLLGQSEDLALTPSADTWTVSSSTGVTDISFSAINISTTGVIKGRASYGADITGAIGHNTTATHGVFYHFTAAATVTLDAAADAGYGAQVCYRVRDAAEAAVIDVDASEKINLAGTALAVGTAITATGAGESVCMVATTDTDGSGTDGWETWGATSGWASE